MLVFTLNRSMERVFPPEGWVILKAIWTFGTRLMWNRHWISFDLHLYEFNFVIFCSVVWNPACSGECPFDRSAKVTLWHPCSGPLPVLRRLLPASHPHRPLPGRRELGETQDHLHKVWVFRKSLQVNVLCKGVIVNHYLRLVGFLVTYSLIPGPGLLMHQSS